MQRKNLCGSLIKQIHDELEKQSNSSLRFQGLTIAQMNILMELEAVPEHELSLKELERLLHVAQSTAAGIVVRLEQKGYIESFADTDDHRVKMIRITASGMECCKKAESHIADMEARLLSGLSETEKKQFFNILQRIYESL